MIAGVPIPSRPLSRDPQVYITPVLHGSRSQRCVQRHGQCSHRDECDNRGQHWPGYAHVQGCGMDLAARDLGNLHSAKCLDGRRPGTAHHVALTKLATASPTDQCAASGESVEKAASQQTASQQTFHGSRRNTTAPIIVSVLKESCLLTAMTDVHTVRFTCHQLPMKTPSRRRRGREKSSSRRRLVRCVHPQERQRGEVHCPL